MTVVIAGGGPTGVDVSGMLAEMKSVILNDYPELTGIDTKIYLVDGGKELLKLMSAKSQQYTFDQLAKRRPKFLNHFLF